MAVISNMDMPLCCKECCLFDGEYGECRYSSEVKVTWGEEDGRPTDCPLKSTDEMIAEIEKAKKFWGEYKRTSLTMEMEEIIHKYCDKENNDV